MHEIVCFRGFLASQWLDTCMMGSALANEEQKQVITPQMCEEMKQIKEMRKKTIQ